MRDASDLVLGQRLAEGGAAAIYAARWRGREVSVKLAHGADDDAAGDLDIEASVLRRVSHPALLEVLDTGRLGDGRPYLVLPRLHGEDLAARLRGGPLAVDDAIQVVVAVAGALTALHAAGVLHRDVKPENVFLSERPGAVFLLDLGLARDLARGTLSIRIRGTRDVMAPERLYGEPATIASEVYELAALAWTALTGALPWTAGSAPSARRGIPPLAIADPRGAALDAVLQAALSTRPERRPGSAAALVSALDGALRGDRAGEARRRTAELAGEVEPPRTAPGDRAILAAAAPAVGSVLADSYRLSRVLGSGAAGTVFEAEHLRLPRRFAIKLLRAELDGGGDARAALARARFRREAETVASLAHPHIVDVFDYDVDASGAAFMVMELLEGETLRDRLRRGPLGLGEVVALIEQAASAVAAAHARGVVHRDLKPSNVFLRGTADGALDAQLLDFGISKLVGGDLEPTASGVVLGSPGYAAPEQVRGDAAIGPAADVFALAAIAFEAITGRRAFDAETRDAALHRVLHGEPAWPAGGAMPPAVEAVLRAGLARRPERRPRSAVAFAEALAAAARATGPIAAGRGRARRPVIRGAIAAALLAAAAATVAIAAARDPADRGDAGRTTGAVPAALAAPAVTPAPATQAAPLAAAPPAERRTVRLVLRPATARAFLDGEAVTGDALVLAPGRHQLRVTAPGYQPVSRAIDADQLGEQLSLRLVPRAAPRQTDLRTLLEK